MGKRIAILGGGQAALQVAVSLRGSGFDGDITLVADEFHLPYMRPPLSKGFLKGDTEAEDLPFRVNSFFDASKVDLKLGVRAEAISREAKTVLLSNDTTIAYDELIIATGTRVRRLSCLGAQAQAVTYLRTLDDANLICSALRRAKSVVVIGGGFIGLEVAAVAAEKGLAVTVIEAADRLMTRAVSPDISDWFASLHRAHGVDVRLCSRLDSIMQEAGGAATVALSTGETISADLIVAGIGVVPNAEIAQRCGLAVADGIVVDETLRTLDPSIYAIGDCARFPINGSSQRLESVQNAVDQAKLVAASIQNGPKVYKCIPWFWSEQFGVKLQIAGLHQGHDECLVVGDSKTSAFSIEYFKGGDLIAVDSINRPGDHLRARKRLLARTDIAA